MEGRFWDRKNIKARMQLNDGSAMLGPSAGLVQRHFVEARLESLYTRNKDLEELVKQALLKHIPGLSPKGDKWLEAYKKINRNLQSCDLTINFKATSWFASENKFETYAQAYERAGFDKDGTTAIFKPDALNPANIRTSQDDKITFPAQKPGSQPAQHRGLMPGRQNQARIETQMRFDPDIKDKKDLIDPTAVARSKNQHFNPKTKQVFAGLNYGRRSHGSNTDYGSSHFVLDDKFKINAIYFGGDTFYHQDASQQAAYCTLGSLVAWAKDDLMAEIIRSCYSGARLGNTTKASLLIEGHLFQELRFTGNIKTIYLDAPTHSVYHDNARKFATKHGAKLVLVGAAT